MTAVVGMVGSGKSSLLSAMLGEIEKENGSVTVQVSNVQFNLVYLFLPALHELCFNHRGMIKQECSALELGVARQGGVFTCTRIFHVVVFALGFR